MVYNITITCMESGTQEYKTVEADSKLEAAKIYFMPPPTDPYYYDKLPVINKRCKTQATLDDWLLDYNLSMSVEEIKDEV